MLMNVLRVMTLDTSVFRDFRDTPGGMWLAFGVVAAVAIAFALGFRNQPVLGLEENLNLTMGLRINVIVFGWVVWAFVGHFVGTTILRGSGTFRHMLRALGLALSPGILMVLFPVPFVGPTISILGRIWILGTGTAAIKETLGLGWAKAIVPALAGWLLAFVLLPSLFLQPAPEDALPGGPLPEERPIERPLAEELPPDEGTSEEPAPEESSPEEPAGQ